MVMTGFEGRKAAFKCQGDACGIPPVNSEEFTNGIPAAALRAWPEGRRAGKEGGTAGRGEIARGAGVPGWREDV